MIIKGKKKNDKSINCDKKRILMIDDDIFFLQVMKEVLEDKYEIITMLSPELGIDYFEENSDKLDLVLTDYRMPGMTGEEVVKHLNQINPNIKICLMTGFSDECPISEVIMKKLNIVDYLHKPFEIEELDNVFKGIKIKKPVKTFADAIPYCNFGKTEEKLNNIKIEIPDEWSDEWTKNELYEQNKSPLSFYGDLSLDEINSSRDNLLGIANTIYKRGDNFGLSGKFTEYTKSEFSELPNTHNADRPK